MTPAQALGRSIAVVVTVGAVIMAGLTGNGFWCLFGALIAAAFWNAG